MVASTLETQTPWKHWNFREKIRKYPIIVFPFMKKIIAKIGTSFLKLLGFTPFWLLYFWADLMYLICFYVIGYRKKTILRNLKNSFPEKTNKEISEIIRKFYRHFSDLVVETIKTCQMSEDQLRKRFRFKNPELLDELYDQGKSVALLSDRKSVV